jgi:hypothetical protein
MSDNTVTLSPPKYDKIGNVHCGVIREGFVSCAGDVASLEDGGEAKFERVGIVVNRQGNEYVFTKA